MKKYEFILPCHFGLEAVLKREITYLGYEKTNVDNGKVTLRVIFMPVQELICFLGQPSGFCKGGLIQSRDL